MTLCYLLNNGIIEAQKKEELGRDCYKIQVDMRTMEIRKWKKKIVQQKSTRKEL